MQRYNIRIQLTGCSGSCFTSSSSLPSVALVHPTSLFFNPPGSGNTVTASLNSLVSFHFTFFFLWNLPVTSSFVTIEGLWPSRVPPRCTVAFLFNRGFYVPVHRMIVVGEVSWMDSRCRDQEVVTFVFSGPLQRHQCTDDSWILIHVHENTNTNSRYSVPV